MLKFVWENPYSDFYRKKYEGAGFNPFTDFKKPEDIQKIPLLTKKELAEVDPDDRFYYPSGSSWQVFSTSGSSFQKPALIYRKQILNSRNKIGDFKLNESKKLLYLQNSSRVSAVIRERAAVFLVGDVANLEATAYQAASINIDSIYSSATLLINFSSYLSSYYDLDNIKFILCGGELITPDKINLIQKLFRKAVVRSRYSCIESGHIGISCGTFKQSADIYHAYKNLYLETKGGESELIITRLQGYRKFGTPIIRYALGDSVTFLREPCSCGHEGRLFKVAGRINHDFIKTGGGMISAAELESLLKEEDNVRDFLLHVYEIPKNDKIKSKLLLEIAGDEGQVSPFVINELLTARLSVGENTKLGEAIEKGYFLPLKIKFVKEIKRSGLKKVYITNSF